MRRILTTGLLVTTILAMAAPAAAQNRDDRDRGQNNGGRYSQPNNPERRGSPERGPQGAQRGPSAVQTRPVPPSRQPSNIPGADNPANPASPYYNGGGARQPVPSAPPSAGRSTRNEGNWQRDDRQRGNWQRDDRQRGDRQGYIPGANNPANPASPRYNGGRDGRGPDWRNDNRRPNYGYQGRLEDRQRWSNQQRWSNNWRNDRRYDWQDYRAQHRNIYRLPAYRAPYGWNRGYSRFSIGVYLNNFLFDQSYWIDDPYYYRLPPAYGWLRWVRYYDDALLVDIRDGYVVDVIHNFFW